MRTAVIAIGLALGLACGREPAPESSAPSPKPGPGEGAPEGAAMPTPSGVQTGPVPADLDPRLAARDVDPLPPDALVKLQSIGRGKSPAKNYRWVLHGDGRLFLARHSGDTSGDWRVPFDTALPAAPTKTVRAGTVKRVGEELKRAGFAGQPPYQVNPQTEDGTAWVVTARIDGAVHEVIYEGFQPPLVAALDKVTSE